MTSDTLALGATGEPPKAGPATRLRFDADRTVLAPAGAPIVVIPVGPQALAARYWRLDTPTPLQIEQAIDEVEMGLMSQRLSQSAHGWLASDDAWLCALPGLHPAGASLTRDAVEFLFNALAATGETGRSVAPGLATSGAAAAALIILRECMHHLGFDGVVALAPGTP